MDLSEDKVLIINLQIYLVRKCLSRLGINNCLNLMCQHDIDTTAAVGKYCMSHSKWVNKQICKQLICIHTELNTGSQKNKLLPDIYKYNINPHAVFVR